MARTVAAQSAPNRNTITAVPSLINGDVVNGHTTPNDGKVMLFVNNGGAVTRWIEVEYARDVDGAKPAPRRYSFTAGQTGFLSGWPVDKYGKNLLINVEHADIDFYVLRTP